MRSCDADADDVLSAALGRAVRAGVAAAGRRPRLLPTQAGRQSVTIRWPSCASIFAREGDEPLPDFAMFGPNVLEFESPPGTFYDCFPLMVMTTSALRSMAAGAARLGRSTCAASGPTLVVDTGDEPGHPEFGWVGAGSHVGTAVSRWSTTARGAR